MAGSAAAGPTAHRLEAETIPFVWFERLRQTLDRAGLSVALYWLPALVSVPVFLCELHEAAAGGDLRAWSTKAWAARSIPLTP